MILSRHIVLSAFCMLGLSLPAAAQNDNTAQLSQNTASAAVATDSNNTGDTNTATDVLGPRPVPKRLTAQERWNRMSPDQRQAIIAEWQKLDETIRPVFPIYRDNALEQQTQQSGTGTAITPVTSPVSIPVPSAAGTESDNTAHDAGETLTPADTAN